MYSNGCVTTVEVHYFLTMKVYELWKLEYLYVLPGVLEYIIYLYNAY